MAEAVLADIIKDGGGTGDNFFASLHLAIKNPEGIGFCPSLAVAAQRSGLERKMLFQFLPKSRPALGAPKRIDLKGKAGKAHRFEQGHAENDDFRI
jgi:hypothetical protein